ncbi:MAG: hypothetical protein ACRELX_07155 [Longimicrobiales bacterium]
MYATCLFCHARLGSNGVLETFPVGRRLAFDGSRGRLWVVCGGCGRWNLSPLEERWEALEACERLFRETRTRVATENIGLARLPDGLDLIRIGRPMRPEFAGWRYGRELLRRRRRDLMGAAGVLGGAAGVVAVSSAVGMLIAPALAVVVPVVSVVGVIAGQAAANNRVVARETDTGGVKRLILRKDLRSVVFRAPAAGAGLGVAIRRHEEWLELTGTPAEHVASVTCARRNETGASATQVDDAVRYLEECGGPEDVLRHLSMRGEFNRLWYRERLALEISLHEELERRALEGELAELERAWQDAEEIAGIADRLLLPPGVDEWVERARKKPDGNPQ